MSREREVLGINGIGVETEKRPSLGVALVIVGIDPSRNGENETRPNLWTVIEKKSKPETSKIAGQISLPGETRKINSERIEDNIIGATAEFTNNIHIIRYNLFCMPESSIVKGRIFVNRNPFDMAILIHEGYLDKDIEPEDKDEVLPNGWMTIEEIRRKDPTRDPRIVRDFVHQIADIEESHGLIKKAVFDFFHFPARRIPLRAFLSNEISSMKEFFQKREEVRDVIGVIINGKQ